MEAACFIQIPPSPGPPSRHTVDSQCRVPHTTVRTLPIPWLVYPVDWLDPCWANEILSLEFALAMKAGTVTTEMEPHSHVFQKEWASLLLLGSQVVLLTVLSEIYRAWNHKNSGEVCVWYERLTTLSSLLPWLYRGIQQILYFSFLLPSYLVKSDANQNQICNERTFLNTDTLFSFTVTWGKEELVFK